MRLIKEEWIGKQSVWNIYGYRQKSWHKEMCIYEMDNIDLENIIGSMGIQYAILGIDASVIERFYYVESSVHIIIDLWNCKSIERRLEEKRHRWQEEVAITLESVMKEEKEEVYTFLTCFYKSGSLKEAYSVYNKWQSERLLCYSLGNRLIDFFQTYEEEIFNYFRYVPIIQNINQ